LYPAVKLVVTALAVLQEAHLMSENLIERSNLNDLPIGATTLALSLSKGRETIWHATIPFSRFLRIAHHRLSLPIIAYHCLYHRQARLAINITPRPHCNNKDQSMSKSMAKQWQINAGEVRD